MAARHYELQETCLVLVCYFLPVEMMSSGVYVMTFMSISDCLVFRSVNIRVVNIYKFSYSTIIPNYLPISLNSTYYPLKSVTCDYMVMKQLSSYP